MPEIYIDHQRYEYEQPGKVLQFLLDIGLDLPFFCYHPTLSIPANCRQCVVKAGLPVMNREKGTFETDESGQRIIRYFPKLMTACSLDMADGMVVHTHKTDPLVRQAQADNLEFILINHPLDCPICDQAGECPLQILTYKFGPEGSRFEHKKVHKPKRIALGPRVTLDAERCINCTRCVRFTDEISKSGQLTIVSRGDKNYPMTSEGGVFDDAYSLNTVDICPVGALTSTDFRFKARVWEMSQTPGIDITNGKGCNTHVWTRDNLVLRITPRYNPAVNDHWMPDAGRTACLLFNEKRVNGPYILLDAQEQVSTSWKNAELTFMEALEEHGQSGVLILGSAHASLEDNYALLRYFRDHEGVGFYFMPDILKGSGDGFLLDDDQAPNTNGVRALGYLETGPGDLELIIEEKKPGIIISLDHTILDRSNLFTQSFRPARFVALATNHSETSRSADLVIPVTCAVEHTASYINVDGRIQRTVPAKETRYSDRRLNLEMSMSRLDHYGTRFDHWVDEKNRVDCKPAWEFFSALGSGCQDTFESPQDVLHAIQQDYPVFKEVSYERMDRENGIQLPLDQLTGHVKRINLHD